MFHLVEVDISSFSLDAPPALYGHAQGPEHRAGAAPGSEPPPGPPRTSSRRGRTSLAFVRSRGAGPWPLQVRPPTRRVVRQDRWGRIAAATAERALEAIRTEACGRSPNVGAREMEAWTISGAGRDDHGRMWPQARASLRQQIGRAGRHERAGGHLSSIASDNPLDDTWCATQHILGPRDSVIDPSNRGCWPTSPRRSRRKYRHAVSPTLAFAR